MVMSYRETTAQIEADIQAQAEARRERQQLRRLVALIDALIEACEEAHLGRQHRVGEDLAAQAEQVFAEARAVLGHAPERDFTGARIVDLMDAAWEVQDEVFDRLLPDRAELPEDVPENGNGVPLSSAA